MECLLKFKINLTNYEFFWRANFNKHIKKFVWQTVIMKSLLVSAVLDNQMALFFLFSFYPLSAICWTCLYDGFCWNRLGASFSSLEVEKSVHTSLYIYVDTRIFFILRKVISIHLFLLLKDLISHWCLNIAFAHHKKNQTFNIFNPEIESSFILLLEDIVI